MPVVATITQCNGIEENNSGGYFSVYPNPTTDELFVDFDAKLAQDFAITLYDVIGKTIYTSDATAIVGMNHQRINLSDVKPGVYFINVVSNSQNHTEKVIVK